MRKTLVMFFVVAVITFEAGASDTLDVYFINVGHGDAILIDLGDWECLIDAGKGTNSSNLELLRVLDCAVADDTIELAVLSHNHWDHYGGFINLIQNSDFAISSFWRSSDPNADTEKTKWLEFSNIFGSAEFFKEELAVDSIPLATLPNALDLNVLAPRVLQMQPTDDNDNENSLVLLLTYGEVSVLLPGDIESLPTSADAWSSTSGVLILKAPHHGRANSATLALAELLMPDLVVVSTGDDVPETAVALTYLGIPFLWTAASETIRVSTDGDSVWVTTDTLLAQVVDCDDE